MSRLLVTLIAMMSLLDSPVLAAPAIVGPGCGEERDAGRLGSGGAAIACGATSVSVEPGAVGSSPSRSSGGAPRFTFTYEALASDAAGNTCTVSRIATYEGPDPLIPPEAMAAIREDSSRNILNFYEPCPQDPSGPQPPSPASVVAASYWEQVDLPVPDPYIAPGSAITGLEAFLETRGQLVFSYSNPTTLAGPLRIDATGAYYVDWGDGASSGPHRFEGLAWPDGDITHTYTHVGSYDVVVEIRWEATWSLGGESGSLRQLRTSAVIDDLPVGQIQAVVVG